LSLKSTTTAKSEPSFVLVELCTTLQQITAGLFFKMFNLRLDCTCKASLFDSKTNRMAVLQHLGSKND